MWATQARLMSVVELVMRAMSVMAKSVMAMVW